MTTPKRQYTAKRILEHLRARGTKGGLKHEIVAGIGVSPSTCGYALQDLINEFAVGMWPDPGPNCSNRLRYWAIEHLPAQAPQRKWVEPGLSTAPKKRPEPRAAAPQVIDWSRAKVTKCPAPTHDDRYQVAPGEQVFGCGFAAVGIGRDVTTGRAWA